MIILFQHPRSMEISSLSSHMCLLVFLQQSEINHSTDACIKPLIGYQIRQDRDRVLG